MKKRILGLLCACFVASLLIMSHVFAQDARVRADYPEQYTVVRGDTLWDISNRFLENPWLWPEIWHVNPQIENPHLIYPGDVVRLIYIDGQPRLSVNRVVKLSPKIRVVDEEKAIESIPLDRINSFLSKTRIVSDSDLESAPHVLSIETERIIGGKGDKIYARGSFDDTIGAYGIYRKGQRYKDPETDELLGVQAIDIGSGRMRALDGDVATLMTSRSVQEIRIGDLLLVEETRAIDSKFFPSSPKSEVNGEIIAVDGGVSQVGKYSIVIVNRGAREGLQVGNVLAVYKRGGVVTDRIKGDKVTLPDERAGLMMVFRTFEKLSLGLILESDSPLSIGDRLKNP